MKNSKIYSLLILFILLLAIGGPVSAKKPVTILKKRAIFAGGCFWCMEPPFDKLEGVLSTTSGYIGGDKKNPTYKEVSSGSTGHTEAVEVIFDSKKISFDRLLEVFWKNIDPTTSDRQFVDVGSQYRPGVFFVDELQKKKAQVSRNKLQDSGCFADKKIVVEISPATQFYPAEDYHQDYYKKNPLRYKYYRFRSGRDQYLEKIWSEDGKCKNTKTKKAKYKKTTDKQYSEKYKRPSLLEIKEMLNDIQFAVTQDDSTEPPFKNEYWDNKEEGIYVDIVSKEPLFSSTDKYKSGTGWPSFVKPIDRHFIVEKDDYKLLSKRVEVRSKYGDSHLGHVFPDGPAERGGMRYCINSAALEFVKKEKMQERGYGQYLSLFKKQ